MRIHVDRDHIREGQQNVGYACPVALAIRDELNKPETAVDAGLYTIIVNGKKFQTPDQVRLFMDRFDYAKQPNRCRPFSFELEGLQ